MRAQRPYESTDHRLAGRFDKEKYKGTLPESFPSLERGRLIIHTHAGKRVPNIKR